MKKLPWTSNHPPLMLAPMQGLTNRAMRALFIDWVRPDTVFTEFLRVSGVSRKRLKPGDVRDINPNAHDVPLVVQLVGHGERPLVEAARRVQDAGAEHVNLNLGCPYGRMTTSATGGKLLERPAELYRIIPALRAAISGSFSIKLRAGYDDPRQIFDLLPLFEESGVDFLVLHPRTVVQAYAGEADHRITAEVVATTRLPVIANGDVRTAAVGRRVLDETGAAGLMLGRGAMADPLLFARLRGGADADPDCDAKTTMLQRYLGELQRRYAKLFCGDAQVLSKLKAALPYLDDPATRSEVARLKRARSLEQFSELVAALD